VVNTVLSGNSSSAYLDDLYEVTSLLDSNSNAFRSTNPNHSTTLPDLEAPVADSAPSDIEFSLPLLSLATVATTTHLITHENPNLSRPMAVIKNPLYSFYLHANRTNISTYARFSRAKGENTRGSGLNTATPNTAIPAFKINNMTAVTQDAQASATNTTVLPTANVAIEDTQVSAFGATFVLPATDTVIKGVQVFPDSGIVLPAANVAIEDMQVGPVTSTLLTSKGKKLLVATIQQDWSVCVFSYYQWYLY